MTDYLSHLGQSEACNQPKIQVGVLHGIELPCPGLVTLIVIGVVDFFFFGGGGSGHCFDFALINIFASVYSYNTDLDHFCQPLH